MQLGHCCRWYKNCSNCRTGLSICNHHLHSYHYVHALKQWSLFTCVWIIFVVAFQWQEEIWLVRYPAWPWSLQTYAVMSHTHYSGHFWVRYCTCVCHWSYQLWESVHRSYNKERRWNQPVSSVMFFHMSYFKDKVPCSRGDTACTFKFAMHLSCSVQFYLHCQSFLTLLDV